MESGSSSSSSSIADTSSSPVKLKSIGKGKSTRGKGTLKGRRRETRGRGRGLGRQTTTRRILTEVRNEVEERKEMLRRRIDELSEVDVRQLLFQTAEKYPSMVFDIMEKKSGPGQSGGYHPSPSGSSPPWCICHHCREMPTQLERLCCKEQPVNCVSQLPDFSLLILNDAVLAIARLYRQDMFSLPVEEDVNRANRHAAYRQFILWIHGRLGAGVRMTIPSCCVWSIRDRYPDPFGQYRGFKSSHVG